MWVTSPWARSWPPCSRSIPRNWIPLEELYGEEAFSEDQALFWLRELRSPPFLSERVARVPELAATCGRPAIVAALSDSDIDRELAAEQAVEMAADREYWAPLRREGFGAYAGRISGPYRRAMGGHFVRGKRTWTDRGMDWAWRKSKGRVRTKDGKRPG